MTIKNPNTTAPMHFVGNIDFKDLQENPHIVNNYKEGDLVNVVNTPVNFDDCYFTNTSGKKVYLTRTNLLVVDYGEFLPLEPGTPAFTYKFIIKINNSEYIIAPKEYSYKELGAIAKFAYTLPENIHLIAYDNNSDKLVIDSKDSTHWHEWMGEVYGDQLFSDSMNISFM